jgi:hypothetical protein
MNGETYDEHNHPRRRRSDHVSRWHQPVSAVAGGVMAILAIAGAATAYFTADWEVREQLSLHDHRIQSAERAIVEIRADRSQEAKVVGAALGDIRVLSAKIDALTALLEREERRRR